MPRPEPLVLVRAREAAGRRGRTTRFRRVRQTPGWPEFPASRGPAGPDDGRVVSWASVDPSQRRHRGQGNLHAEFLVKLPCQGR